MTISTTIIKNSYNGTGSQDVFAYAFKIATTADMEVIIRASTGTETVKTITTHYTVSGAGTTGGGKTAIIFPVQTTTDWYNSQTLALENSVVFWKSLAPKPTSNVYVTDRNGEGDGIHVAVVDDYGTVTGIKGNVIEKHVSLSKAVDSILLGL